MNCYKRVSMLGQQCLYNAFNERRKDNVCAWGGGACLLFTRIAIQLIVYWCECYDTSGISL